jgi:hypothetical protein
MRLRQQEQFSFMGVPLRVGSFAASPRFAAGFTLLPLTQPLPGGRAMGNAGITVIRFVGIGYGALWPEVGSQPAGLLPRPG